MTFPADADLDELAETGAGGRCGRRGVGAIVANTGLAGLEVGGVRAFHEGTEAFS